MDYNNSNIFERSESSPLWKDLSEQNSKTLPILLERYILLRNFQYIDRLEKEQENVPDIYDIQYLHLLVAELVTVVLNQEERLRNLESENSCNCDNAIS